MQYIRGSESIVFHTANSNVCCLIRQFAQLSAKLYWSDWNREEPKIEYSNLDGSQRAVLVNSDLKLPNNLVIDYDHNDLCWVDAGLHRIECLHLYSKSRRVIYSQASKCVTAHLPLPLALTTVQSFTPHWTGYPFDIAIGHSSIYWTDWET